MRELATPALLAVLTPVIIGFGINYFALGAFLAAVILTGQLMANFLSNSGGAWDNAKKYIEDGNYGGKGSDAYRGRGDRRHDRRPVQGHRRPGAQPVDQGDEPDLVADPARGHQPARTTTVRASSIAGVALVVLIGAILFSKRSGMGMTDGSPEPQPSRGRRRRPTSVRDCYGVCVGAIAAVGDCGRRAACRRCACGTRAPAGSATGR